MIVFSKREPLNRQHAGNARTQTNRIRRQAFVRILAAPIVIDSLRGHGARLAVANVYDFFVSGQASLRRLQFFIVLAVRASLAYQMKMTLKL